MAKRPVLRGIEDPTLLAAYKEARRYLRRKYVTGLAIGPAIRGGVPREMAICVMVKKKIPEVKLTARQRFPAKVLGVPVDVIEFVPVPLGMSDEEARTRRARVANPLLPGVAIGDQNELGTVGMIVRKLTGTGHFVLTAAHVLPQGRGSMAFQPAGNSSGGLGKVVEVLWDSDGDAALVALNRPWQNKPLGAARALASVRDIRPGDLLEKSGCMSGVTKARIDHIGSMNAPTANGNVTMHGFFLKPDGGAAEISMGGDSGAVWYDPLSGEAVGLTVAGEDGDHTNPAEWTFACHLSDVFLRLKLRMP